MSGFTVDSSGYVTAGPWHGWAWTATESPNLGTTISPVSGGWNYFGNAKAGAPLCAQGNVALTPNYGTDAMLGISINVDRTSGNVFPAGTWTPTGTGVKWQIDNLGGSPLRIWLLGLQGFPGQAWCATVTSSSGTTKWTDFNSQCWGGGIGTVYDGVTPLNRVMIEVPGLNNATQPFNFCLEGIAPYGAGGTVGTGGAGMGGAGPTAGQTSSSGGASGAGGIVGPGSGGSSMAGAGGVGGTTSGGGTTAPAGGIASVGGLSTTGGTTSSGGTTGAGGTTSGMGGTGSGGCTSFSPSAPACASAVGTGSPGLIGVLDDGHIAPNDGRQGVWYTFNDGLGTQTPLALSTSCTPPLPIGGQMCTSGSGFTSWGAGLGLTLDSAQNCSAGLYDASAYTGVSFTASGTVQSGYFRFAIPTAATEIPGLGGTCPSTAKCSDYYGVDLTPTATPQTFTYYFSNLRQEGWGSPVAWNPAQMLTLEWTVKVEYDVLGDPLGPANFSNICISDLTFF